MSPEPQSVTHNMNSRVRATHRWKFGLLSLLVSVALLSTILAVITWYKSPSQKTRRLLNELADRPGGHIDLAWSGRLSSEIDAEFKVLGPSAVPYLIEALSSPDPTIRYLAAGQLGNLKDTRGVEPLIVLLQNDRSDIVRIWAAVALGDIGDHRAMQHLLNYIHQPNAPKRWCAIQALGKIGDNAATEPILRFVDDEDIYTRAYTAETLGFLDHSKVIDPLIKILEGDSDPWVRSMAATSLGRIQNPRAYTALTTARQDSSWRVKNAVREALTQNPGR